MIYRYSNFHRHSDRSDGVILPPSVETIARPPRNETGSSEEEDEDKEDEDQDDADADADSDSDDSDFDFDSPPPKRARQA